MKKIFIFILLIFIFFIVSSMFVKLEVITINSSSMETEYPKNSNVVAMRPAFFISKGDVVLHFLPDSAFGELGDNSLLKNSEYIHKVIAKYGDTVKIKEGKLLVNNTEVISNLPDKFLLQDEEIKISVNTYYLIATNDEKIGLTDSLTFGPFSSEMITGKILKK